MRRQYFLTIFICVAAIAGGQLPRDEFIRRFRDRYADHTELWCLAQSLIDETRPGGQHRLEWGEAQYEVVVHLPAVVTICVELRAEIETTDEQIRDVFNNIHWDGIGSKHPIASIPETDHYILSLG